MSELNNTGVEESNLENEVLLDKGEVLKDATSEIAKEAMDNSLLKETNAKLESLEVPTEELKEKKSWLSNLGKKLGMIPLTEEDRIERQNKLREKGKAVLAEITEEIRKNKEANDKKRREGVTDVKEMQKERDVRKEAYEELLASDKAKAEKYLEAMGSDEDVKYWKWDDSKGKFVDATRYTAAGGNTAK